VSGHVKRLAMLSGISLPASLGYRLAGQRIRSKSTYLNGGACSDERSQPWTQPADIKAQYRSASILKNRRVVFNIKGNDYRLWSWPSPTSCKSSS
jgi:hypothetical protein